MTQGHRNYILRRRIWGLLIGGTDCKELEIETENKMEKLLRQLLF